MPKRRGKGASGASRRLETPLQMSMEDFLRRLNQEAAAASGSRPLESLGRSEVAASFPGLESTLSPDARTPPPQPQRASSPRESSQPEEADFVSREAEVSEALEEDETAVRTTRGPEMEQGSQREKTAIDVEAGTMQASIFSVPKPMNVTLDSIWDLVITLGQTLSPQIKELEEKYLQQRNEINGLKQENISMKNNVEKIDKKISEVTQIQTTLIKDNLNLRRKVEMMENNMRLNNLRFLNFPKIPSLSAKEVLKKYFCEVLNVPNDAFPPFSKIYYLPSKNLEEQHPLEQQGQGEQMDITLLLESSMKEVAIPATLLATVVLSPDKNWILQLYFKNRHKEFLGCKVQIFPDVTRESQKRRKEFLLLKPGVAAMGASFLLQYPCKCIVKY